MVKELKCKKINISRFEIMPKQDTKWQNHIDHEILVIFNGTGHLYSDDTDVCGKLIQQYDIVTLPPFKPHMIKNIGDTPLIVGNIWWQDNCIHTESTSTSTDDLTITIALPSFTTPNGKMHLGHLAGPVLNADVFKRAQKLLADLNTYQLCGTIGYQTHVAHTAKTLGLNYIDTALKYSEDFIENYKLLSVEYDTFTTISQADCFEELADKFILDLYKKNFLVERTTLVPYCEHGHGYVFEANVRGICPHCNHRVCSECEYCAEFIPDHLLITPVCTLCNNPTNKKSLTRLFIPLDKYRHLIQSFLMTGSYRGNTANFVNKILLKPLPDIPISIYSNNGIAVNIDGFREQKIYSAVELVPRFLTALQDLQNINKFAEKVKFRINLFFGYDNSYLRCIIFPILLKLTTNDIECNSFFGNEFYLLNGSKFSTSRNHVLYAHDITQKSPPDWLRLYLMHQKSSILNRNFVLAEMYQWINTRRDKLLLILNRMHIFLDTKFCNIVPESGIWETEHNIFYERLKNACEQAKHTFNVNNFDSSHIVRLSDYVLEELYIFSYMLIQGSDNSDVNRTTIALSLLGLKVFATISWPAMPNIMEQILQMLGEELTPKTPLLNNALEWIRPKLYLNYDPCFLKEATHE